MKDRGAVARETARSPQPRSPVRAPRARQNWISPWLSRRFSLQTEQHDLTSATLETAILLARQFDSYIEGFALRVVAIPAVLAIGEIGALPPALEQEIAEHEKRSRSLFEKLHARAWCAVRRRHKSPVKRL